MTWLSDLIMFNYTQQNLDKLNFVEIAPVDKLPAGERLFVDVSGKSIVIFNLAGKLYALGDVCSHDNGPVGDGDIDENEIICPRHGARFEIRTGKATSLPAILDIPAYPLRVENGMIVLGIPINN
jgi:3-phenylpropionate/trans-cinnamate dioxygenase ferredoxin component